MAQNSGVEVPNSKLMLNVFCSGLFHVMQKGVALVSILSPVQTGLAPQCDEAAFDWWCIALQLVDADDGHLRRISHQRKFQSSASSNRNPIKLGLH